METSTSTVQHTCTGDCCGTGLDGAAFCAVPSAQQAVIAVEDIGLHHQPPLTVNKKTAASRESLRGGLLFGIACITSPCCTPLIVPLLLSLLAGTPVALWLGHNLGWVYGVLTLMSAVSFVLALRRMGNRR